MGTPRTAKIDCVVGARPNFVKIAPIIRALHEHGGLATRLIHTGQHYDAQMNAVFFDQLAIPEPECHLEIGSGTHSQQTARIMMAIEPLFIRARPDLVLLVGDVNSTMAAALVAAKLDIPIAHVEAGLRSFDRSMPEEINRIVTDHLCALLFATERSAVDNLLKEGIDGGKIELVGNVMIDTLKACMKRAIPVQVTLSEAGAPGVFRESADRGFALVTIHRPSNVDDPATLKGTLEALAEVSRQVPLIFPMHPRTERAIARAGLGALLPQDRVLLTPPLSYLHLIGIMSKAKLVITDSGGVQEETTALGVPCLTVRENTERPVTVAEGTNIVVGTTPTDVVAAVAEVLATGGKKGRIPALWDGNAAGRIAAAVASFLTAPRLKDEPASASRVISP
jgi:UDP-N-acetylglucosamine 2-epimerase (non-hydrolysing)